MSRVVRIMLLAIGLVAVFGPTGAWAAAKTAPIQISLFEPVQIFPKETAIHGVRLNLLYGVNSEVIGLDAGLVNRTEGLQKGLQYGLVGIVKGDFHGWQDNAVSITAGKFYGLQTGFYTQVSDGVGVQLGYINVADSFNGLQFGLVNMTDTLKGLQIGLVNMIKKGGAFPVFPIVNWSF